ncbi:extracellular solute-binding protein [Paenibacillus sp. HWE-109]|uniref:extracellular solute-binding protein n=1 Tax=Paenibacillus sp. HWE-109 TaxID=1306526 RepID=UPI001EE0B325|nr:extracellular solute-binding protein [Paenibacillus sp. HWE-109]UKS27824.1 extracellular solute-binding protein [Paenibacillus sp. HWE-109]
MRTRALISVAGVIAATFIVSACSGLNLNREQNIRNTGESVNRQTQKVETVMLTIRHTQVKDTQKKRLAMLQEVVKATEAKVPGLSITLDGVEDKVNRFEKLRSEMAAGNPPEIFDLFGGTDTKDYVKADRLLDLTPILGELGLMDKFYSFEEFTVDGKIYGIPMAGYVEGLYYNKKLLAQAQIAPPKTWEELLAAAAVFKAKKVTPFAVAAKDSWVINMMSNTMWVRTAGSDTIEGFLDGSKKWTDANVVDAFEKYHLLVKNGYFQEGSLALSYAEQQNKFSSGEAAFMFDGSWANTPLLDPEKSAIVHDVGFMSFPAMGGPGDGYINGGWSNAYGFSKKVTPAQLVAIKEFIRQMYNEPMQKRQLIEEGMPPAMKLQDISNVNPLITQILTVFADSKGAFPAFDSRIQTKVREKLERGMQELIGGRTNPASLMSEIQKQQEASNKEETHTR